MLKIVFETPIGRARGERRSKVLRPGSSLYNWIVSARAILTSMGKDFQTREPHIELLGADERDDLSALDKRIRAISGTSVPATIELMGRAIVIPTGVVSGYGETHATVAFMTRPVTATEFGDIQEAISDIPITQSAGSTRCNALTRAGTRCRCSINCPHHS